MKLLLVALLLVGCASTEFQKLDEKLFYKRDIAVTINGHVYDGVVTVPRAPEYRMKIEAPGDMDMVLFKSCAREDSGTVAKPGFFKFSSKRVIEYTYRPLEGLEDAMTCPLVIEAYDAKNNQHSWAFIDFLHPNYQVPFALDCNGRRSEPNEGVGICQQKMGLIAMARFGEPIRFATPHGDCPTPKKVGDYTYRWEVGRGECLYNFDTKDGRVGKMTIIGYEGILLRNGV